MPTATNLIYARKSSESDDRQVLSIDSQIQELKLLAARRGIKVDDTLTEARSAKAPGRPVFEQLMRLIEHKEVASVLCWKLDRLARNHADTGRVLQALADHKLHSVVTFERDYTADGNDRFLGNFELGMATKYIDDLKMNVRRGNRARFLRGWPNYRPPIGYLEDRPTKTIVKDPDRFELVRRLWDLLLGGAMRPSQILKVANEDWRLRTRKTANQGGNPLQFQHLYKIFSNPFYLGLIRLKSGETFKGAFPAMVTPEEFEYAQRILGRPDRPRPSKLEFAYGGLLRCARCQGVLVPERHVKPSGKAYVYYRCRARPGKTPCAVRTLPEPAFEEDVLTDLRRLAISRDGKKWIADNLRATLSRDLEQRDAAGQSLRRELEEAVREGERLITMRQKDQIDEDTFERRRLDVLDRQARLRLKLDQPHASPEDLLGRIEEALELSASAPAAFQRAKDDPVRRRQTVQAIYANLSVDDRKVLTLAKEPFSFLAQARDPQRWWAVVKEVRTWLLSADHSFLPDLGSTLRHGSSVPRRERAA
jgi:site-specific DNA recombinase